MTTPSTDDAPASAFVTTRWTQVLSARGSSGEAQLALGELCTAYWMPVFRFVRRSGFAEDAARDLTQEFFAQLIARNGLDTVEPGKGRFRSFLLGAVKHFLSDQLDRAHAAKRGGGHAPQPLETETATTSALQIPDPTAPAADVFFDRHWAFNLIDRALSSLAEEMKSAGKCPQFELLKPWLVGDADALSQAETGQRLGLSEGAVKVAVHRLRKRFRELIRAEIAQTVASPDQVQEELRYLAEVMRASS
jgi:RNA polymerase sigma factor (sigma-70 family)